ncbi:MAG: zinc ABC transporter substrate-binding protein [Pseudolysinimonas sp.]
MLRSAALIASTMLAIGLAGCTAPAPDPASDGVLRIVASTNVYGDLAQTIAGPDAEVTSIVDDPSQDPHEFEANGRVQLAMSRADIVIVNGGGYDDFATAMLTASGNTGARLIDAVELSGLDASADGFNEHVWYDAFAMEKVVEALALAVGSVDAAAADDAAAAAVQLRIGLSKLESTADEANALIEAGHLGVIITEPVPLYLLMNLGFENLTPPEFSEAIEEDADVPPALLQSVLNLLGDGSAALVVYNEQTGGPQTDAVIDVATDNHIPAIGVTETLPEGLHYLGWQSRILDSIISASGIYG